MACQDWHGTQLPASLQIMRGWRKWDEGSESICMHGMVFGDLFQEWQFNWDLWAIQGMEFPDLSGNPVPEICCTKLLVDSVSRLCCLSVSLHTSTTSIPTTLTISDVPYKGGHKALKKGATGVLTVDASHCTQPEIDCFAASFHMLPLFARAGEIVKSAGFVLEIG